VTTYESGDYPTSYPTSHRISIVIPAKAGIQNILLQQNPWTLDPGFRRGDDL
jgi:hypothetical protein